MHGGETVILYASFGFERVDRVSNPGLRRTSTRRWDLPCQPQLQSSVSQNKHLDTHRLTVGLPRHISLFKLRPHLTQPNVIVFITEQHTDRRQEMFVLYPMALVKRKTRTNKLARISLARRVWWRARGLSMYIQVETLKKYYEVPFKPRCLPN